MFFPRRPPAARPAGAGPSGRRLSRVLGAGLLGGTPPSCPLPSPNGPGMPLLGEHARGRFTRPHLRGHRSTRAGTGRRASRAPPLRGRRRGLAVELDATTAGPGLVTEAESVAGRSPADAAPLDQPAADPYLLDGPRAGAARRRPPRRGPRLHRPPRARADPQRHRVTDGLWLRESRGRATRARRATMAVLGTPGFATTHGEVLGVHVGWSGNSVLRVERGAATGPRSAAASCCCPARSCSGTASATRRPWVFFVAADDGLDGLAAACTPSRNARRSPRRQPVVLNVWEAVYFDHDLDRLTRIADRAARVGVERFVLDDGWFRRPPRRHPPGSATGGSTPTVWPDGLVPWSSTCTGSAWSSGCGSSRRWSTPTPTSTASTPTGSSSAGDRVPLQHRNQLVLDLSRTEVFDHVLRRMSTRCWSATPSTT